MAVKGRAGHSMGGFAAVQQVMIAIGSGRRGRSHLRRIRTDFGFGERKRPLGSGHIGGTSNDGTIGALPRM